MAQVFNGIVQVVYIECQVLYTNVNRPGELVAMVGRLELEELDIRAVGTAQKADGLDAAARRHAEPIPWDIIPRRFTLIEQLAAEHLDEEGGRLLHVGHGDADVVYTAQTRQCRAIIKRCGKLIHN